MSNADEQARWLNARYSIRTDLIRHDQKPDGTTVEVSVHRLEADDQNYATFVAAARGIGELNNIIVEAWVEQLEAENPEAGAHARRMMAALANG